MQLAYQRIWGEQAKLLGLTQSAIGYSVDRGEVTAKREKHHPFDQLLSFLWTSPY